MSFNDRLRAIMAERGFTQSSLARRIGVTRSCTHSWCWGMTEPNIGMLVRLRRVLNCTWDELLGR